jgi:thiosulfate dehydrogenase [quinone] large subunit
MSRRARPVRPPAPVDPGRGPQAPSVRTGVPARGPEPAVPQDPAQPGSAQQTARPRPKTTSEQLAALLPADARVPALVLLPMRFFFGATFLYAGMDKILDPNFLRADGAGSIGQQLHGFVQVSPLAPLITTFAEPFPVLIGFAIALLEIAIGLGTILGLLYRWAALAGMLTSFLFFLTASWATHPYYYGPDLPYAFGWLTLTLAGDSGVLSLDAWLAKRDAQKAAMAGAGASGWRRDRGRAGWERSPRSAGWQASGGTPDDPTRRKFLELGILAMASVVVAGFSMTSPFRGRETVGAGLGASSDPGASSGGDVGLASPSPAASAAASAGASPAASAAASAGASPAASGPVPSGTLLGNLSQVATGSAASFRDPTSGDPAIFVHLKDGSAVAYDAVCTHNGCTVEFDPSQQLLFCPCHGAVFDPAHGAQVLQGPAPIPLTQLPIKIDKATGGIYLQG